MFRVSASKTHSLLGSILILNLAFVSEVYAKKYQPKIHFNYKLGNERNLERAEIFMPLWQSGDNLVFIDSQGWLDNEGTKEGNVGLGFRKIINDKFIIGTYGFYDQRKTENDNKFGQVTLGLELFTENWELRSNAYLADDKSKLVSSSSSSSITSDPYLLGNYVYIDNTSVTNSSYESNLSGFDVEIGRELPFLKGVKLFAAYYHFSNNDISEKVDGYRIREEYNFYAKGKHSMFLELEHSEDDLRSSINFLGLRYSYNFLASKDRGLSKLESKMENRVVRDIDIITKDNSASSSSTVNTQLEDDDNRKIIYVDNSVSSSGDGTNENPYQTLQEASEAASVNDIIYVYYGDGSAYTDGITLQDGQKLLGQGRDFTVSDVLSNIAYADHVLVTASSHSKITKNFTEADATAAEYYENLEERTGTVTLANNNEVRGFEISATNTEGTGLLHGEAIMIANKTGNVISYNKIISAPNDAILIVSGVDSQISNVISNNEIYGGDAIETYSKSGSTNTVTIVENDVHDIWSAIYSSGGSDSTTSLDIRNNDFYNMSRGMYVNTGLTTNFSLNLQDNNFYNNSYGLDIRGTGTLSLKAENNNMYDNTDYSLVVFKYSFNAEDVFDFGGGELESAGNNAIIGNVYISNANASARGNYWGGGDMSTDYVSGSEVESDDYLTSNPFAE